MMRNWMDRPLMALYSLSTAFLAVFVMALAMGWIRLRPLMQALDTMRQDPPVKSAVLAVAFLFVLASFRYFLLTLKRDRTRPPTVDRQNDMGEVRISLETVENLSLKAVSRVNGLKETRARVRVHEDGLEIMVRTFVDGEMSIPELTENVQKTVREYLEDITGIPVVRISVFVANVLPPTSLRSRVE